MTEYHSGTTRGQDAENACKIFVSNLPPHVGYEDIRSYFESSKRTGGGPIRHVDHNEAACTAEIQFESPDSVASVLAKQSIRIAGYDVDVKEYNECAGAAKPDSAPSKKIMVSNIPKGVEQEDLELYFETEKRTGGGLLANLEYEQKRGTAVIEFDNPDTVQSVLAFAKTSGIYLRKASLKVEMYSETKEKSNDSETSGPEPPRKILVSNIPKGVEQEDLELYFETEKRTGGGSLVNVEYDQKRGTAVIEFDNPDTVQSVLAFAKASGIHLRKASLKVEMYSETKEKSNDSETSGPDPPRKILVSNIAKGVEQEDLELYFETEKRTGGGPLANVEYDQKRGIAVIEFDNPDTVQSVLEFAQTSGIQLRKASLKVEMYSETKDRYNDTETSDPEQPRKILVSNIPTGVEQEDLELYFETEKRTGGGPLANVEYDQKRGTAVIEFKEPKTVQSVLAFTEASGIRLRKAKLEIKIYIENTGNNDTKPPRKILVSNIPSDVEQEDLELYFETAKRTGGGPIADIDYDSERRTAVIAFKEPETVELVLSFAETSGIVLQKAKLKVEIHSDSADESISPEPSDTEPPRKVLVTNIPNGVEQEDLELYFENEKRTGGGPVEEVKLDSARGSAVVEFVSPDTVQSVLTFSETCGIRLRGSKLNVESYCEKSETSNELATMLIVKNLPNSTTEEFLEMFLETKSNGGIIKTIEYNKDDSSAIIDFEDHQSVECLLEQQPLTFRKTKVNIESYQPEPIVYDTIRVRGTPKVVTKENMELYFESESCSGGGKIKTIEVHEGGDENTACIKFASEEVARAVSERPHRFMRTSLNVVLQDPTKAETGETDEGDISERPEDDTETKDEPQNTIKVKGLKGITSPDTVRFYFENKRRAGGGTILDFSINEDDGEALITFESDDVAKDVLDRSHKIEGRDLKVVQYRSPALRPYYPNKVLMTGVGSETTEDCLVNFLEAKSGIETTGVMYGEDTGCKLVTFESEPDVEKLQNGCNRTRLEGKHLSVSKVQVSNCINVSGFSESITADTIELYFENRNRSSGGPVEKIDMKDGYCLVYFENYEDLDGVMKKEHNISGEKLDVILFHECLGEHQGDGFQPAFRCPSDLVTEVEHDKLKFLLGSKTYRDIVEKKMAEMYASLVWPDDAERDKKVSIKCLLKKDTDKCCELARSWNDRANAAFERLLDAVIVTSHKVSNEIWPNINDSIREINITDPTKVLITLSKADKTIVVVGVKQTAEEVADSIDQVIQKLENDLDVKRRTKTKQIPIEEMKLKVFEAANMKKTVENRVRGAGLSVNHSKKEILITGTEEAVTSAGMIIYEITANYASQQIPVSPPLMSLLQRESVQQYLQQKWNDKNITAAWKSQAGTIDVCVSQSNKLKESIDVFQGCFYEDEIELDDTTMCVTRSDKWNKMVTALDADLMRKFVFSIIESQLKIVFCSTADVKDDVINAIDRFTDFNNILTEEVVLPSPVSKYLSKHQFRKLQNIANLHKDDFVTVNVDRESRIVVSGNKEGVSIAKAKVDDLSKKIQMRRIKLNRPGLAVHMATPEGKDFLPDIEKTFPCIIEIESQKKQQKRDLSKIQATETFILDNGRTINLYLGDMTDLPVDSFICAADKTLKLTAGVGKSIITKGGVDVRKACKNFLNKNKELAEGQVMSSPPGTLDCKQVFFVNGPQWKNGRQKEVQKLEEAVTKAVQCAARENSISIALPAVCCGKSGFPIDIGTQTIAGALKKYFRNNPQSTIRLVYLSDIVQVEKFSKAVKDVFKKAQHFQSQGLSASTKPEDHAQSTQTVIPVIVKGQLAKQEVNVIVNTTNNALDMMKGAVSTSITKAAGPAMKTELDKEYPKGIREGQIAYTMGHKLKCVEVFHTSLHRWDTTNALETMKDAMKECLLEAHGKGYQSIALPALGTGGLGYPTDVVAKAMFETVQLVSDGLPDFQVKDIRFVVYENDKENIQIFEETRRRWKEKLSKDGINRHSDEESDDDDDLDITEAPGLYNIGDMVLEVKTGDLTRENCDCIVNSTDVRLDLTRGAVATALLRHAGQNLATELSRKRSEMRQNRIVITDGYNLPCKKIIHVEAQQDGDQWKEMLLKCLQFADDNGVTSIAFPAIGSGLGMKTEDIATLVFTALTEFQTIKPKHLSEVRFVLFDSDKFKEFCNIVDSALEQKASGIFSSLWSGLRDMFSKSSKADGSVVKRRKKEDTVYVTIYAATDDVINDVKGRLSALCDSMTFKKSIERPIIKRLDEYQINEIETVGQQCHVSVKVNIDDGVLQVDGIQHNAMNAIDRIYDILRDADLAEYSMDRFRTTAVVVQWFYIQVDKSTGEQKLVKYDPATNGDIEDSYRAKEERMEYISRSSDGSQCVYVIDFNRMKMYPLHETSELTTIIRRDLLRESHCEFPESWAKTQDAYSEHVLQSGDQEYDMVHQMFMESSGGSYIVNSITRIQNRHLWQQYQSKKMQIEQQNPPGTVNERVLWHGTKVEAVDSINQHGFNRSYCYDPADKNSADKANATAYGKGVYFAQSAVMSCSSNFAVPDADGNRHVYYCHVLTGEYEKGSEEVRAPPPKPSGGPNAIYDSLVDNPAKPTIFVIFNDTQAYPEYLISFKRPV